MEKTFKTFPDQSYYDLFIRPSCWELVSLKWKKVLDLGCCTGWIGLLAKQDGALVTALDIFSSAVHPSLKFVEGNKECMPFNDGEFDVVLTANVLHHGDLNKTCEEVFRVLCNDGEFLSLQEPCRYDEDDESSMLKEYCLSEIELGIDERRPSYSEYKEALKCFNDVRFYKVPHDLTGPRWSEEFNESYCGAIAIHAKK